MTARDDAAVLHELAGLLIQIEAQLERIADGDPDSAR